MGVVFASIRLPFDYRTGNVYRDAPFEKKQPEFGAVGAETEIGEVTDATSSDTEATAEEFDYVAKEHGTPPNIIDGTYSAEVVFMADKFARMTQEGAVIICTRGVYHDPKFNACFMDTLKGLLDSGEESEKNDEENEEDLGADPAQRSKQLRYWATLLHWWSPYPELLLYYAGLLLQYCLPDWGFSITGHRFTLNSGKWSQKEQLLATVMVNCAN
ncbi:LOW QUALITY PROTEIN: hypothetical protein B0I73DRAFT_142747 [Yarrowia lipolytica]|uniref:Uncharacterized protein n=1 Tax=Yarrowia lipolytica TaxID=4952 RepID=A0A371C2J4_YARLL|nr:LOW QUALITY PROTEIN: hypothetical protein B0I71DRAFT_141896 [Yarrowia lipolytica]RDW37559.1 LOW QUALITY PROTEIN: hypothetical protein B0I73DRAFT_142747 [Yarrowia lipolytica]RDW43258.1 LOW QUALITY PROTEIN: hypothetical protein B0I74DRAFT_131259 [Yarrowia lipolytica]RDW50060.1 LOW QUALITY PROTEIN: hypothetical protein B0I75DRAFT_131069 [Yarrowia lipolytica]